MSDASFGSALPLADVRIIELGTMIAGPFAGTMLGDFGADVIKIETQEGDTLRKVSPMIDGTALPWANDSRNKKCIVCNLHDEDDRAALLELVRKADVLVENFRPGSIERWELGPEILHEANPELVIVRVSGFGQTGSRSKLPAFDRVIQAMSGYARTTGLPGSPPLVVGNFISDYVTGVFAALGCMIALHARDGGAGGQVVDVSSLEVLVRLSEVDLSLYDRLGELRPRLGNGHLAAAPMNAYEAADRSWVMIHVPTDRMFVRLAEAMHGANLADDPRFATGAERVRNREALDEVISSWFAARTSDNALETLLDAGVPASRMQDASDLVEDQDLLDRGAIIRADSPIGPMLMPGVVPKLTATPGRVRFPAAASPGPPIREALGSAGGQAGLWEKRP